MKRLKRDAILSLCPGLVSLKFGRTGAELQIPPSSGVKAEKKKVASGR